MMRPQLVEASKKLAQAIVRFDEEYEAGRAASASTLDWVHEGLRILDIRIPMDADEIIATDTWRWISGPIRTEDEIATRIISAIWNEASPTERVRFRFNDIAVTAGSVADFMERYAGPDIKCSQREYEDAFKKQRYLFLPPSLSATGTAVALLRLQEEGKQGDD